MHGELRADLHATRRTRTSTTRLRTSSAIQTPYASPILVCAAPSAVSWAREHVRANLRYMDTPVCVSDGGGSGALHCAACGLWNIVGGTRSPHLTQVANSDRTTSTISLPSSRWAGWTEFALASVSECSAAALAGGESTQGDRSHSRRPDSLPDPTMSHTATSNVINARR